MAAGVKADATPEYIVAQFAAQRIKEERALAILDRPPRVEVGIFG